MSEWDPATEAEVAMRDALRANDQEQYFRILARTDILLPIAPEVAQSGDAGWGTWTTEGRTHVLAFTSPGALRECLAGHPGTHRLVPFRDLAGIWPNVEWWLAVNPGLPIEGYLPSWFVTQISRGDVRLPGRTLGARARIEQAGAKARATAQVPVRSVPNQPAPTPIERQRMKAEAAPPPAHDRPQPGPPKRDIPPPDVAPPGAFLPTRADRPLNYERTTGAGGQDRPADFRRPRTVPPAAAPAPPSAPRPPAVPLTPPAPAPVPPPAPAPAAADLDRPSREVPGGVRLETPGWSPGADTRPANGLPRRPTGRGPAGDLPVRTPGQADAPPSAGFTSANPLSGGPVSSGPVSGGPVSGGPVSGGPVSGGPVSGGPGLGGPGLGNPGLGGPGLGSLPARRGAEQPDGEGDPRRYWPRREPARNLGQIFTEHAEPVIPAAWQPPPDLPLPTAPPLPTRQPGRSDEPPGVAGGALPTRPGLIDPSTFRSGDAGPLPSRPGKAREGGTLPTRPGAAEGDSLPSRTRADEGDALPSRQGRGFEGDAMPSRPRTAEGGFLPSRAATGFDAAGVEGGAAFEGGRGFGGGPGFEGGALPYGPRTDGGGSLPARAGAAEAGPLPYRPGEGPDGGPSAYRPGNDAEGGSLPYGSEGGALPSGSEGGALPYGSEGGALPYGSEGGALPSRPGRAGQEPGLFRQGDGEPLPTRRDGGEPLSGEVLPPATGPAWLDQAGAGLPRRGVPEEPPLPFDRPVFDRPGFSRLDIENPEVDAAPTQAATSFDEPPQAFPPAAGRARAAGFGRADGPEEHSFFSDAPDLSKDASRSTFDRLAARDQAAREQAARAQAEQAERERAEQEQADRRRTEREQAARDRAQRDRAEREQAEREQADLQRAERARVEREQTQRDEQAREQAAREQEQRARAEREQALRELAERELAGRELAEQERARLELAEWDRIQQERAARELAQREQAGRDQAERDQAEREQAAWALAQREQADRDQAERERAEREQAARALAQREQADREQAERDQAEREQADREQAARALVRREQAEREQADRDQVERERAERERAEREQAEREQAAWEQAEHERVAHEEAEHQRLEQAERQWAELEQAEVDRAERERAEREQTLREQAERDELARAKAEREQAERNQLAERQLAEREAARIERVSQAQRADEQATRNLDAQLRAIEERVAQSAAAAAAAAAQPADFAAERPFFGQPIREDEDEAETEANASPEADANADLGESTQPIRRAGTYHDKTPIANQPEPVYEPEVVDEPPVRLHAEIVDAEVVPPKVFVPANKVEEDLLEAVQANSTDRFLSTLLLAKVIVPEWNGEGPIDPGAWRTEHMNGVPHLVVFTSQERMTERLGEHTEGSWLKFTRLIRMWPPGDQLAFAVNPESPAGAVLPGTEVVQLATWAAELGLGVDEPEPVVAKPFEAPQPRPAFEPPANSGPLLMQKPISPEQLSYYLERGYDRVSGFVHRAGEVAHLQTPEQLYHALGLGYAGSSFKPDADEAYVLRWKAYRGDLYRIPYGGAHEAAMRAMEGWVIERPPFRGNGFAPSDTSDVIAEFKVDSARLPHGAELWRLRRDGGQELIARLDADGPAWRKGKEL